jgi:hypothetical protein
MSGRRVRAPPGFPATKGCRACGRSPRPPSPADPARDQSRGHRLTLYTATPGDRRKHMPRRRQNTSPRHLWRTQSPASWRSVNATGSLAENAQILVPEVGIEPTRPEGHGTLSPGCWVLSRPAAGTHDSRLTTDRPIPSTRRARSGSMIERPGSRRRRARR